jgi:hypothetical protein
VIFGRRFCHWLLSDLLHRLGDGLWFWCNDFHLGWFSLLFYRADRSLPCRCTIILVVVVRTTTCLVKVLGPTRGKRRVFLWLFLVCWFRLRFLLLILLLLVGTISLLRSLVLLLLLLWLERLSIIVAAASSGRRTLGGEPNTSQQG